MCLQQAQHHPSLAYHTQFYKDKQTTSRVSYLPITAVAVPGPGCAGNETAGEESSLLAIYSLFMAIKSHVATSAK